MKKRVENKENESQNGRNLRKIIDSENKNPSNLKEKVPRNLRRILEPLDCKDEAVEDAGLERSEHTKAMKDLHV